MSIEHQPICNAAGENILFAAACFPARLRILTGFVPGVVMFGCDDGMAK